MSNKKLLCLIFGHTNKSVDCPYTKQTYVSCTRCDSDHHRGLSFK
jgi:hypothetical protein